MCFIKPRLLYLSHCFLFSKPLLLVRPTDGRWVSKVVINGKAAPPPLPPPPHKTCVKISASNKKPVKYRSERTPSMHQQQNNISRGYAPQCMRFTGGRVTLSSWVRHTEKDTDGLYPSTLSSWGHTDEGRLAAVRYARWPYRRTHNALSLKEKERKGTELHTFLCFGRNSHSHYYVQGCRYTYVETHKKRSTGTGWHIPPSPHACGRTLSHLSAELSTKEAMPPEMETQASSM